MQIMDFTVEHPGLGSYLQALFPHRLAGDPKLGAMHAGPPKVTSAEFVRLLLAASIRGLVSVSSPGRPIDEVVAEFTARGEDR